MTVKNGYQYRNSDFEGCDSGPWYCYSLDGQAQEFLGPHENFGYHCTSKDNILSIVSNGLLASSEQNLKNGLLQLTTGNYTNGVSFYRGFHGCELRANGFLDGAAIFACDFTGWTTENVVGLMYRKLFECQDDSPTLKNKLLYIGHENIYGIEECLAKEPPRPNYVFLSTRVTNDNVNLLGMVELVKQGHKLWLNPPTQ
ncbi:hypothetical protein MIR68_009652 [Amoeboaphelidium protococcarum]|nr:hypothetical protein MIR68_009652 [Amoeboaphelidium protococcarum]